MLNPNMVTMVHGVSSNATRYIFALFFALLLGTQLAYAQDPCGTWYVSPNGASGAGAGTTTNPASLNYAIQNAVTGQQIKLAIGYYHLSAALQMRSGIGLEGGFDPAQNWAKTNVGASILHRDSSNVATSAPPAHPSPRLIAVECVNINSFSLNDLTIEVADADSNLYTASRSGISTYGVYASGCANYGIYRVNFDIGTATNGRRGLPGTNGQNGVDGAPGGIGRDKEDPLPLPSNQNNIGGNGGTGWSAGFSNVAAGGRGGNGGLRGIGKAVNVTGLTNSICPPIVAGTDADTGQTGAGALPNLGGRGGTRGQPKDFNQDFGCSISLLDVNALLGILTGWLSDDLINGCSANQDYDGFDGAPGQRGPDGLDGIDGFQRYNQFYVNGDGEDGQDGIAGGGGGGGGGGGSVRNVPTISVFGIPVETDNNGSVGGGGGGGGEGGQGGQGGQGGGGGGGVFGVFLWNNGANGQVKDCEFQLGDAGLGTTGRLGGIGGNGGQGGCGGGKGGVDCATRCAQPGNVTCSGAGCNGGAGGSGGDGGAGGDGGDGGDGVNGPVFEVYQNGTFASVSSVRLPGEAGIVLQNTGCSNSELYFSVKNPSNVPYEWFFDGSTIPPAAQGANVTAIYTTLGDKKVLLRANGIPYNLTGFVDIYRPGTVPVINLTAPSSPILCENQGQVATFGQTLINPAAVLAFDWKVEGPGVFARDSSAGATTFSTPPINAVGTYIVTLRVRTACCGWSIRDSFELTVIPTLVPTINMISTATEICPGTTVTFNAVATNGGLNPAYVWRRNGSILDTTLAPSFTTSAISDQDVFTVEVVPDYQCTVPATATSNPQTITVYAKPQVTCDPVTPRRLGNPSNLSASIASGRAPYTYTWSILPNFTLTGSTSASINESFTFGTPGSYTTTLVVTDANGCSDTCQTILDISPFTPLVADFTGNVQEGCDNLTVTFTATGNATSFDWDFGDGNTTTTNNPVVQHTYSPGFYTVRLVASDAVGSLPVIERTNYVRVYPTPEAIINILGNKACAGEPIIFDSQEDGAFYDWDLGDGTTSTLPTVLHIYNNDGNYPVRLRVWSDDRRCFKDTTINVNVQRKPEASFNPVLVSPSFCEPATLQFENTSQGVSGPITRSFWNFANLDTVTTSSNPTYTFFSAGDYPVFLVVENQSGCLDTAIQVITVLAQPTAEFTADQTELESPNLTVNFTDQSILTPGTYQWTFPNGTPTTFEGPNPPPIVFGEEPDTVDAQLIVTDQSGCQDTFRIPITIKPVQRLFVPNVFTPNGDGVNDVFLIYADGYTYDITIFNRWGEEVFRGDEVNHWNGKKSNTGAECQESVYVYLIKLTRYDGLQLDRSGSVTLVR